MKDMSQGLKQQAIENLENVIAIFSTYSYWEAEKRVLIEIVGMVKKSEGEL